MARMFEYCSRDTPWNRQLWRLGALLEIRELLECWQAQADGTLTESAVKHFASTVARRIARDPGFGDNRTRGHLIQLVNRTIVPGGHDSRALERALAAAAAEYLTNCRAQALESDTLSPGYQRGVRVRWSWPDTSWVRFQCRVHTRRLTRNHRMGKTVGLSDLVGQAAEIEARPTAE